MRKYAVFIAALFTAVTSLSMYRSPSRDLLNEDDYRQEQEDSKKPAVTAPDLAGTGARKSFNQWQCFPSSQIKIECDPDEDTTTSENQDICYPHLLVEEDADIFDFQLLTPDGYLNSNWILDRWSSLLRDEESLCVYSAYLPDISGPSGFVFSVDRLKTSKGYWDYDDEQNWKEPEEDKDQDSGSG
jgi:hypothetical protein